METNRRWELFLELYDHMPRGGPGNIACARRALGFMPELPRAARVADLGCGPGQPVLELAELLPEARITALDILERFVIRVREQARRQGLGDRLDAVNGDMRALTFPAESLDLIWSEGAVYFMGFPDALRAWRAFLKPGGYLAVSDAVWLRSDPPDSVRRCWATEYPAMRDLAGGLEEIRAAGYQLSGHFTLPREAWWEGYYVPLQASMDVLAVKYRGDAEAEEVLEQTRQEIETYRDFGEYYGYEFFVCRKP